jgi:hypothetical protein
MKTFVVAALLALTAVSGAVVVSELAAADGCVGNCGSGGR